MEKADEETTTKKVTKQTLCWLKTLFSKQRERERERCAEYSKTKKNTIFLLCFRVCVVVSGSFGTTCHEQETHRHARMMSLTHMQLLFFFSLFFSLVK